MARVLALESTSCFLIPLQYLQRPRVLHPFASMDCAQEAPESIWMQPDETAGRILKEKKVIERASQPKSVYGGSILFKKDSKA